jgi:AbiU2
MTAMKASTPKDEIRLLAKAIGDELHLAIANYQVFAPTGRDAALIDRVNTAGIHDEFNVVSEALQLTTISTLCRIWDKTGGAARLGEVARLLRNRPDLASDRKDLEQWLSDVERVENSSEKLQALRGFRNVSLAHKHNPNQPDPRIRSGARRVAERDEARLLEGTLLLVERLNVLVGLKDPIDFFGQSEEWRQRAEKFWRSIR